MAAAYKLHCFDIMTILFKIILLASKLNAELRTVKSKRTGEGVKSTFCSKVGILYYYWRIMHINKMKNQNKAISNYTSKTHLDLKDIKHQKVPINKHYFYWNILLGKFCKKINFEHTIHCFPRVLCSKLLHRDGYFRLVLL